MSQIETSSQIVHRPAGVYTHYTSIAAGAASLGSLRFVLAVLAREGIHPFHVCPSHSCIAKQASSLAKRLRTQAKASPQGASPANQHRGRGGIARKPPFRPGRLSSRGKVAKKTKAAEKARSSAKQHRRKSKVAEKQTAGCGQRARFARLEPRLFLSGRIIGRFGRSAEGFLRNRPDRIWSFAPQFK